jgi:hypothetical protein
VNIVSGDHEVGGVVKCTHDIEAECVRAFYLGYFQDSGQNSFDDQIHTDDTPVIKSPDPLKENHYVE